jgi:excinuclease ABC subunit C
VKRFDRKFGADWLRELPAAPAVYLFKDADGEVLYAGKAVNIRRRLQSYRNASRRKVHRKMRDLVREASELEVRLQLSERDALLAENELIRNLRPRYNVDGAYTFLYPAIGCVLRGGDVWLCFTTHTDAFVQLGLRWHGVFRSRLRSRDAFEALVSLLGRIGHLEPRSRMHGVPRLRGSRAVAFRRVEALAPAIAGLLAGEDDALLEALSMRLLEKPDARRDAEAVGEELRRLRDFYARDARRLCAVRRAAGIETTFVAQEERDALFIAHGGAGSSG